MFRGIRNICAPDYYCFELYVEFFFPYIFLSCCLVIYCYRFCIRIIKTSCLRIVNLRN